MPLMLKYLTVVESGLNPEAGHTPGQGGFGNSCTTRERPRVLE